MSDNNNSASGGIGFAGLLTITFIVLKLTKVINWSWWWVLSPTWIPAALVIIGLLIYAVILWIKSAKRKKRFAHRMKEIEDGRYKAGVSDGPILSKWQQRIVDMKAKQKR